MKMQMKQSYILIDSQETNSVFPLGAMVWYSSICVLMVTS